VVVLIGAKILRRLLRSELSSSVKESDLLLERGTVTVTIMPGQLGRARIRLGSAYIDRYARAKDTTARIAPGTEVQVVDLGPDGIVVEELP
jgi:membrane protein implicated in regulation of membrane protease activity